MGVTITRKLKDGSVQLTATPSKCKPRLWPFPIWPGADDHIRNPGTSKCGRCGVTLGKDYVDFKVVVPESMKHMVKTGPVTKDEIGL